MPSRLSVAGSGVLVVVVVRKLYSSLSVMTLVLTDELVPGVFPWTLPKPISEPLAVKFVR